MDCELIKLPEFARLNGVSERNVQKHISNHKEELEGHVDRRGRNGTWLDSTAQEILQKYITTPLPPVMVDDTLSRKNAELTEKLIELQEKYIALQAQMLEQRQLTIQAQQQTEDQTRQLRQELAAALAEAEAAKAELGRKLSWRERLTGKRK